MKKKLYYLQKALDLARKDLKVIDDRINKYLHVDTTDRKAIHEWLENHKNGYDLGDIITKKVDIEIAIGDLNNIIYIHSR